MLIVTRVFHALHRYGVASAADVALSLGIDQRSAAHALYALKCARKARHVGSGRNTRWELTPGATAPIDHRGTNPNSALARQLSPAHAKQHAERQALARAKLAARAIRERNAKQRANQPDNAWADLAAAFARFPLEKREIADYDESRQPARPQET